MNELQGMSFVDMLLERTKEDKYQEFFQNLYSRRNKKGVIETYDEETKKITTRIERDKEIFIFIDTCTWLNHADKTNFDALVKLVDLQQQRDVILLIPEQLMIEWNRNNEEKLLKTQSNIFNDMINKTKSFRAKIVQDEDKGKILDQLIEEAQSYRDDLLRYINNEVITLFNDVMKKGMKISTKDKHLVEVAKLALEKKAPFHKNKNSAGDALLFISVIECLEKINKPILYFVTDNSSDFSNNNQKHEIHPDFGKMAEDKGINLMYSLDLNTTLDTILEEVTDFEYVKSYKEAYYKKYHVNFQNRCENKKCQGRMIMDFHPWDGRGRKVFYKCERCSNIEETGEYQHELYE